MNEDNSTFKRDHLCAYLIGTGGALLSLSAFLPWVNVVLLGNLTLIQLAQLDNRQSSVIVGVIVGGILALAGFSLKRKTPVLVLGAVVTAAIAGLNVVEFAHAVSKAGGLVGLGDGSYLAMIAVIVLFVGAMLPSHARLTVIRSPTPTLSYDGESCGSCGKPVATNSVFCPQCGVAVGLANQANEVEARQNKKRLSEAELATALEKLDNDVLTDEEWSNLGIDDNGSIESGRIAWNRPIAVGLIAIVLILTVGAIAVATRHHHNAVTGNSSRPTTSHPSGSIAVNLPLYSCKTTYGIPGTKAARLPNYVREIAPYDDSGKLAVFSDAQGIIKLVGPSQWGCDASIGADGTSSIFVGPVNSSNNTGALAPGSAVEQVDAFQTSASPMQAATQACALFPEAMSFLYPSKCSTPSPASETVTSINAHVVEFFDPSRVHGSGNPSGGANPAQGVMTYYIQTSSQTGGSYAETCVLPADQHSICSASVHDFVSAYGNE